MRRRYNRPVMYRIRMLMAWVLLAALPLQGLAAASMVYCGPAGKAVASQVHAASADDQHGHAHGAGAGEHVLQGPGAMDHASMDHSADGNALPDSKHTCSICAACGNAAAITPSSHALAAPAASQSLAALPLPALHSRAPALPDKPPRG